MALDPFGGDILKLEGESNRWRRRIGNYRIFLTYRYRCQSSSRNRDSPPHIEHVLGKTKNITDH
jgi:hypothetical protein